MREKKKQSQQQEKRENMTRNVYVTRCSKGNGQMGFFPREEDKSRVQDLEGVTRRKQDE